MSPPVVLTTTLCTQRTWISVIIYVHCCTNLSLFYSIFFSLNLFLLLSLRSLTFRSLLIRIFFVSCFIFVSSCNVTIFLLYFRKRINFLFHYHFLLVLFNSSFISKSFSTTPRSSFLHFYISSIKIFL